MELWGNLKDFSLPDVIQLVGFGRKTGVLSVESPQASSRLFFHDGNIIHAELGNTEGEEAVYRLFRLLDGEFRFRAEVRPQRQTIFMDPTNLVMEAARLLDEATRGEEASADGFGEVVEFAALDAEIEAGIELSFPLPEEPPAPRKVGPEEVREEIKALLESRFGRDAKRLTQAVEKCGSTYDDFQDLAARVERFVSAFVDPRSAKTLGQELRVLIGRLSDAP